jgi:NAD-dependent dihydropyrimidine dehydrogenase PreA subunit
MVYGFKIVKEMTDGLSRWMDEKGYSSTGDFVGRAVGNVTDWQYLNLNYIAKARINQDLCIKCGRCHIACEDTSHQAIMKEKDGKRHFEVMDDECVGCNLCVNVCPVEDCITMIQLEAGMLDAVAVHDLGRLLELLAAGAVQALVVGHVQVVRVALLDPPEEFGDGLTMPWLGGADPVVVAALESAPEGLEALRHAVHPGLRRIPLALGRLDDRLGVLVHPHQEAHVVPPQSPVAGDGVGSHLLQRVPQVGIAVGVVDGGGQIERRHS